MGRGEKIRAVGLSGGRFLACKLLCIETGLSRLFLRVELGGKG
jgi:hypothetical protein